MSGFPHRLIPSMKTSAEIRQQFLDFFASKGHEIVPSSPLVPGNDPTLLFTNSGMVQFKDMFLGAEKRSYTRAASSQRSLRAGGKHNDLENVGYTARHHTFFEMLGNFSFGDYFKREAIGYAWELLTEVYRLPAEKLWVTVYHTDDEAYAIWSQEIGVPAERIVRIGDNKGAPQASDNFWAMGDTGPCGPCTEIFYDHGPAVAGGPPGSPDEDGDRYIEIWNLVFMQFERAADGSLCKLPKPCVDTGMGLERLTAVLQHVNSNYDIDLMRALVEAAALATQSNDRNSPSLRVIADHIRAASFLIVDGVLPSNEGRGYVLRRIIRRALRHGHKLGQKGLFFHTLVAALDQQMGPAYPELRGKRALVEQVLKGEEERFAETLDTGMKVFEEIAARSTQSVSGADAFRLYDTYGFPVDLTADVARERGLTVDMEGFEQSMQAQRERGRAGSSFDAAQSLSAEAVQDLPATQFLGYETLVAEDLAVVAILKEGEAVAAANAGEAVVVILDRTPFYAESGGQVGDQGRLFGPSGEMQVEDTVKLAGTFHGHVGSFRGGRLQIGDRLAAEGAGSRRQAIVGNHSATHLLHAALRQVLGEHVHQKGSLVAPDRLRFDFSHFEPLTADELAKIERMVNAEVRRNLAAEVYQMGMQEAIAFGAMALFGEKYGERVRVLKLGDFSTELCGGTHVQRSGDIGWFRIIGESAVAAGVRRIEAVTGAAAEAYVAERERILAALADGLHSSIDEAPLRLHKVFERQRELERELATFKARAANAALQELADGAQSIEGIRLIAARIDGLDAKALREGIDHLKQRLGDCVLLLAAGHEGKLALIAGVHGRALDRVKAGELIAYVAGQIGGKGGGRADLAQGGGEDGPAVTKALASVADWLHKKLS